MAKWHICGAMILAFTATRTAEAIPPPWTLEEAKAKADLILIAKLAKVEPVSGIRGANHRIGFRAVETLKSTAAQEAGDAKHYLLFHRREKPKGGGLVAMSIGGTGHPEPGNGDLALVFLKKHETKDHFTIVVGSFGYLKLTAGTPGEKAALKKRIGQYREWGKRMADPKLREAMGRYYDKALAHAESR